MEVMLIHNIMFTEMKKRKVDINKDVNITKKINIINNVNITYGFLLLLIAVTVLAGPERTLIVLLASGVHEAGHILALWLLGAGVDRFSLRGDGAELIFKRRLSYPGEIAAALSGPLAGAALTGAALWAGRRWGSGFCLELAAVSAVLTGANLLPVSVADGGRALDAALCWLLGPDRAYFIGVCLDGVCVLAAFWAGLAMAFGGGGGLFPLLFACFLLNGCCKKRGFGVKS